MMRFDRQVQVIFQRGGVQHTVDRHRVAFQIEKFAGPVDNRGTVRLWNLGGELRRELARQIVDVQSPTTTVFLSAGYREQMGLIFRGVVLRGVNSRMGPDWITELEGLTGAQQMMNATLDSRFGFLNTKPRIIVERLFAELKWGAPRYAPDAKARLDAAPPVTQAFTGLAGEALTRLLARYQCVFTLEDDGPMVTLVRGAVNPADPVDSLPMISEGTGLLGTPKIVDHGVQLRTLLNPGLKVGRRIRVESDTIVNTLSVQGAEYVIVRLKHMGDIRTDAWFTELDCVYPNLEVKTEPAGPPMAATNRVPGS